MDKNYYLGKQANLTQKLAKTKDQFVVDIINLTNRLADDINEIQNEHNEITGIIQEAEKEEKKKPIKKG